MADRTTGGLTEAPIGQLPALADLYDDALLPVEFQGEARHIKGRQWKRYAQAATANYVDSAKDAAEAAAKSAAGAADSAKWAANSASDASGSAQAAKEYSGKPPIIRNNHWWTWNADSQRYEDTGQLARGNIMYAVFRVDAATGELWMYCDEEYTGPGFRLAGGDLEVVLIDGN